MSASTLARRTADLGSWSPDPLGPLVFLAVAYAIVLASLAL